MGQLFDRAVGKDITIDKILHPGDCFGKENVVPKAFVVLSHLSACLFHTTLTLSFVSIDKRSA